ncbi:MAG: hypothetical protein AAF585_05770 [Verrucomicrobiota bacterium]
MDNPYLTPSSAPQAPQPQVTGPPPKLPGVVFGLLITDLVFCCIRGLMFLLGLLAFAMIAKDDPIYQTAIFESISAFVIAAAGIPAAILLLKRNNTVGVPLAWVAALGTVMNIIVGGWQAKIQLVDNPDLEAAGVGGAAMAGAGIMMLIRVGILITYIVIVLRANKAINSMKANGQI